MPCRMAGKWSLNPEQTCPGSCGLFRLVSRAQARAEGVADFAGYARSLSERLPLRLEGEPVPKIREGALCLSEPAQAEVCLATFHVSRTLNPLLGSLPTARGFRRRGGRNLGCPSPCSRR